MEEEAEEKVSEAQGRTVYKAAIVLLSQCKNVRSRAESKKARRKKVDRHRGSPNSWDEEGRRRIRETKNAAAENGTAACTRRIEELFSCVCVQSAPWMFQLVQDPAQAKHLWETLSRFR